MSETKLPNITEDQLKELIQHSYDVYQEKRRKLDHNVVIISNKIEEYYEECDRNKLVFKKSLSDKIVFYLFGEWIKNDLKM